MAIKKAGVWRIKNGKKTCIQEPTKPPKRMKTETQQPDSTPPAEVLVAEPLKKVSKDDSTS